DPAVGAEAPVLLEPAVERAQARVEDVGRLAQLRLDADARGREDEARLDVLLVHAREARLAIDELRHREPVDRVQVRAPALLGEAAEERLHRTRRADVVARRDAEEVAPLVADVHARGTLASPVDPDRAIAPLRLDVAGEAVVGLVVVVVGVEDAVTEIGHGGSSRNAGRSVAAPPATVPIHRAPSHGSGARPPRASDTASRLPAGDDAPVAQRRTGADVLEARLGEQRDELPA